MNRLYDSNNFPNQSLSECICSICQDVIFSPIANKLCPHIHCKSCIGEWSKTNKCCPTCRADLKTTNNKHFELKNIFSLKYHCLNCESPDILVGNEYCNIISHNSVCSNSIIKCDMCQGECLRKDLETHQKSTECQVRKENITLTNSLNHLKRKYDDMTEDNKRLEKKINELKPVITATAKGFHLGLNNENKHIVYDYEIKHTYANDFENSFLVSNRYNFIITYKCSDLLHNEYSLEVRTQTIKKKLKKNRRFVAETEIPFVLTKKYYMDTPAFIGIDRETITQKIVKIKKSLISKDFCLTEHIIDQFLYVMASAPNSYEG